MTKIQAAKAVVEAARNAVAGGSGDDLYLRRLRDALTAYDAAEDVGVEVVANEIGCTLFGEAREAREDEMSREPGCCVDKRYKSPRGCTEGTCMTLPPGTTCGDCAHAPRCTALFGAKVENTCCDFFPRRFTPKRRTR